MHKKITFMTIAVCLNAPAMATDVADFGAFYNLYKTATTQNDITITSDITSTRLLSVPGAQTTNIDGGDFGFNGGGFSGFTVSRGYDFSLTNAGAFSVFGTNATITKSYNNFVQTPQGAVVANLGGNVIIENSAFENNSSSYGGGVLYQNNSGTTTINNSVFANNRATRGDGGVIYNEYETTATMNNVIFQNNSAQNGYGGVAFNDGTLNITNGIFTGNSASGGGATLYNSNTMNLDNVRFINNTSTDSAGAIYTTGDMRITNATFTGNSGPTGGALGNYGIIGDTLYATITNSSFNDNTAEYGGAVYNWDDIYIIDSNFENNSATENGGAIFNLAQLYLIANNADINFSGNTVGGISNAVHSTDVMNINANTGRSVVFNDAISGTGQIIINRPYAYNNQPVPTGGRVMLNADMGAFNGDIEIHNGTVQIGANGKFFDANDLHIFGGTLDVGNASVSAKTVSFDSGSTLALNIQNADTYGTITANAFTIADGANMTVVLSPDAMSDKDSLRVQILRSDSDISDMFFPTINNNVYDFVQLGNGWYEIVRQSPSTDIDIIADFGGNQNNYNTASVWQKSPTLGNAIARIIFTRMDALMQTSGAGYVRALTALAPTGVPALQMIGASNIRNLSTSVPSAPTRRNGWRVWVSGNGGGGNIDETAISPDTDMYTFGGTFGAEYSVGDWDFGGMYTYQYHRLKSWARTLHAPTHGGGVYAHYAPNNWIMRANMAGFYTDMSETKDVARIAINADIPFYTYGAWLDAGYRFESAGWALTPRAGARYMIIHRRGYSDTVNQRVTSNNLYFLTPYADLEISRNNMNILGVNITPVLNVGASYDVRTTADNAHVELHGLRYNIYGDALPKLAMHSELELNIDIGAYANLGIGIGTELRDKYTNYFGNIRIKARF